MNLVSCSHVKRSRILALKARDLTKIRPLTFERISNRLRLNAQISIPATLKVSGKKIEERLPVSQSIIKAVSRPRFPYYARGRKMKFRSFHSGALQKAFDFQTAEHLACVNRACGSDRLQYEIFLSDELTAISLHAQTSKTSQLRRHSLFPNRLAILNEDRILPGG